MKIDKSKARLLASSSSVEGIKKLIAGYFHNTFENVSIIDDKIFLFNRQTEKTEPLERYIITRTKNRFLFRIIFN